MKRKEHSTSGTVAILLGCVAVSAVLIAVSLTRSTKQQSITQHLNHKASGTNNDSLTKPANLSTGLFTGSFDSKGITLAANSPFLITPATNIPPVTTGNTVSCSTASRSSRFTHIGGHIEPEFIIRSADEDAHWSYSIETESVFSARADGWQWHTESEALRLGRLIARDAQGQQIPLKMAVDASTYSFGIDQQILRNASLPVTISARGSNWDRRTNNMGWRLVKGWKGAFPAAAFHVNGELVEIYSFGNQLTDVPESDWWKGCSPTAAGMLLGHYDRQGYNGSFFDNLVPGSKATLSNIGDDTTNLKAAIASSAHIQDYYVKFGDIGNDPMALNRPSSEFNCLADFMGTSQSSIGNADGYSQFFYYADNSKLTSATLRAAGYTTRSGLCGIEEYVQSTGYDCSDLANQYISGYGGRSAGFTFNNFMDEINAGRPVLIHLTGHTMLGLGYDATSQEITVYNTWGTDPHVMTWGGQYASLQHIGVSVVTLRAHNNTAPAVANIDLETDEDTPLTIDATWFHTAYSDTEHDDLQTIIFKAVPQNGSLSFDGTAVTANTTLAPAELINLVYTPNKSFYGTDTFTWAASDHHVESQTATVSLAVNMVNVSPTGQDESITTNEDTAYQFSNQDFTFNDSDDEDVLDAVRISSLPAKGQLLIGDRPAQIGDSAKPVTALSFLPDSNESGTAYASFDFQVQDPAGAQSGVHTMSISVIDINDAPVAVATAVPAQALPGESVTLTASGSYDPDNSPSPLTYTWEQIDTGAATVSLVTTDTIETSFSTTIQGRYKFMLIVSDSQDMDTAEVEVVIGNPMAITLTQEANEGDTLTGTVTLPEAFETPTRIWLTADPADSIQSSTPITIPAGTLTTDISLTVINDTTQTGDRYIEVKAHCDSAQSVGTTVFVTEDDIPKIIVIGNGLTIANMPSSSSSADFGAIRAGQSSTQVFQIRNTGTAPLKIADISLTSDYYDAFSLEASSVTELAPDASTTLQVIFSPTEDGSAQGLVTITSNDPETPDYSFEVSGNAEAAPIASGGGGGGGGGCNLTTTAGTMEWYYPLLLILSLIVTKRILNQPSRLRKTRKCVVRKEINTVSSHR